MSGEADHTRTTLADALARLQRLEECEAARNHLHAYASALDAPTPDAVAALFTEDGTLTIPSGTWEGRDGIAAFYRDRLGSDPSEKRHFIVSPRTRWLGPGSVEVASYFVFTGRGTDKSVIGWGDYLDRIRVVDGVPLFEAKTITPHVGTDLTTGWAAD